MIQEDGQCCSPFIIAARFGYDRVVKMLLEKFSFNIEQEGQLKFDGCVIEGASALWCAAGNDDDLNIFLRFSSFIFIFSRWSFKCCKNPCQSWSKC